MLARRVGVYTSSYWTAAIVNKTDVVTVTLWYCPEGTDYRRFSLCNHIVSLRDFVYDSAFDFIFVGEFCRRLIIVNFRALQIVTCHINYVKALCEPV